VCPSIVEVADVRKRRTLWIAPLVVLVCSLAGGALGPGIAGVSAATPGTGGDSDIDASVKQFTRVMRVVEENFSDTVNTDKSIYKGAIPGMLRTLDPHSNFYDPSDFEKMREEQRGRYYGIGAYVGSRNGRTIVTEPFAGSPAIRAGVRIGDAIIEVDGKRTDNMNTTEVASMLKGKRGTTVHVVIAREGYTDPLKFDIVRDEIPRKSVDDLFFISPGIAYLKILQFNENTSREMEDNFKKASESEIKGLILDLRDNPGGLLNEGVAVAGHFLQRHQTVVSHRGRASADKPYTAQHSQKAPDYPIVVLVSRYSASAAEIVAGALQDHDRAWILGENTFGKGLVQTVFPLVENTALALTTAKYYTPSGRCIQRDYSHTSFFDYYYRKDVEAKNPLDVKMTDSNRTVYGGGGISPDEKFAAQPKLNAFQIDILRKSVIFDFANTYFAGRDAKIPATWEPDDDVMNRFHMALEKAGVTFKEADWVDNLAWSKTQIKRQVHMVALGSEDARRLAMQNDPMVLKAVESMPKARKLMEDARKMIVQRVQRHQ
jgi:carboxyl-terminal processing protease